MCTSKSRRVRRASNQRSRYFVNHYYGVESNYGKVCSNGNSAKYEEAEQPDDDAERPEVEPVEFIDEEIVTETQQTVREESETCTLDSGTVWSFLKYAAIISGIGLCTYLLCSRD